MRLCVWLLVVLVALPAFAQDDQEKNPLNGRERQKFLDKAQEPPKKVAAPDADAQAEATKTIKEVYGDDWAAAKTAEQKQALAKKLLQKAHESESDRTAQYVLLRIAKDVATEAADADLAFQAIDELDQSFRIDAVVLKTGVLTTLGAAARTNDQHKSLAEKAAEASEEATANDNFAAAKQLNEIALAEAKKSKDAALVKQATDRNAQIDESAKAFESVKAALATLAKSPTDPDANLTVGKYRCFVKGDWDFGLPMLALGSDEKLKAIATKDLQGAASSDDQAKLGDAWWNQADPEKGASKKAIQDRARHWYETALPGLSGLAKDKAEKRLKQSMTAGGEVTNSERPTQRRERWIDVLLLIDPQRTQARGDWRRDNNELECAASDGAIIASAITPSAKYEVRTEFTTFGDEREVSVYLPIGETSCFVSVSGRYEKIWIRMVDGKDHDGNPTKQAYRIDSGKTYLLDIAVAISGDAAQISVKLNGENATNFVGRVSQLSVPNESKPSDPKRIGIGAHKAATTFHSIQYRDLSARRTSAVDKPGR